MSVAARVRDWQSGGLATDKRFQFVPAAQLLITIPPTNDRLLLRRLEIDKALEKAGADELFVTSPLLLSVKAGDQLDHLILASVQKRWGHLFAHKWSRWPHSDARRQAEVARARFAQRPGGRGRGDGRRCDWPGAIPEGHDQGQLNCRSTRLFFRETHSDPSSESSSWSHSSSPKRPSMPARSSKPPPGNARV